MTEGIPRNANEFIEEQIAARLAELQRLFRGDAIAICGPIVFGVDDVIRNAVEEIRKAQPTVRPRGRLVVVLTTDGGYIEPVNRIVETLRHHYRFVDFVVPEYAYSAGTVLALSGDSIWMDYYSRLGPIDPQVQSSSGRAVPALGYLEQWNRLVKKAQDGTLTAIEAQLMIEGFDQGELYYYEQARELSISLLEDWLARYKFKDWKVTETRGIRVTMAMKKSRAAEIATKLNQTEHWHSHGFGISRDVLLRQLRLKTDDFGADPEKSDRIRYFQNLLTDYMMRRGHSGAVQSVNGYVPYAIAQ